MLTLWRAAFLLALTTLGTLLVGSEVEGTSAGAAAIGSEKVEGFIATATGTGTVTAMKFHTAAVASTCTSVVGIIFTNNAGQPGTVLGEATFTGIPGENVVVEITGFSVAVVSGTKYFLELLPMGGTLKLKKHKSGEAGAVSLAANSAPVKVKKGSEVTGWNLEELGPFYIAATGTVEATGARQTMVV